MLAPPWLSVPPPGYGGIEQVVDGLCEGLVERGHHVTLFAAPGSQSRAEVRELLASVHPDEIQISMFEVDHVARAFADIDRAAAGGEPYDVVHDHCGFTAFAMADRLGTPLVHTLHGPFVPDVYDFYEHHAAKAPVVAISDAQLRDGPPELQSVGVIPNPLDASAWTLSTDKDDFLLWIGRINPDKGPHRAIEVARRSGRPLILAGPVQPGNERFFNEQVQPQLDGDQIQWIGEVGGERKQELFERAAALLMPIRWAEPFGMVMAEALACGTPVLAFPEGSAPEIVQDGRTGFLVGDERHMAERVGDLGAIDPQACRTWVEEHCSIPAVAERYEQAYLAAIELAGVAA